MNEPERKNDDGDNENATGVKRRTEGNGKLTASAEPKRKLFAEKGKS